jgi:transposase
MDTSEQAGVETSKQVPRRRRSIAEKRRIVEETLAAGASVARVARQHEVNANQVFYWRKKYREGRLGVSRSSKLLPVTVSDIPWSKSEQGRCASTRGISGAMEMQLPKGQLRVTGKVDAETLRTVLECLLR